MNYILIIIMAFIVGCSAYYIPGDNNDITDNRKERINAGGS